MKKYFMLFLMLTIGLFLVSCLEDTEEYKVSFETYAGEPVPEPYFVTYGTIIDRPDVNPVKEGYTFVDWYQDKEFETVWLFDSFKILGHTKLYAKFEKDRETYVVDFNVDGGSPFLNSINVLEGDKVPVQKVLEKPGYVFKGWYKNELKTIKYDFNSGVYENLTLYALWEEAFVGYPDMRINDNSFTIALLPDTQIYTDRNKVPEGKQIFDTQMQYIVDRTEAENIKLTLSLGDIVDRANDILMWNIATNAYKILDDAMIPYGVVAGNHDFPGLTNDGRFYVYNDDERTGHQNYLSYFPKSRAEKFTENYGGHSANGWNSYYYFEGNGQTYMVMFLDYHPSPNTIEWAHQVMNENKNIPTIISSHILIRDGSHPHNGYFQYDEVQAIFDNFISKHDQIFLAVSGHYTGQGYAIMENDFGNDVIFIMVDYQGDYKGGNGVMNLIEFDTFNDKLHLHSFSPYVMQISEEKRHPIYDIDILTDLRNKYSLTLNYNERFSGFINK